MRFILIPIENPAWHTNQNRRKHPEKARTPRAQVVVSFWQLAQLARSLAASLHPPTHAVALCVCVSVILRQQRAKKHTGTGGLCAQAGGRVGGDVGYYCPRPGHVNTLPYNAVNTKIRPARANKCIFCVGRSEAPAADLPVININPLAFPP